MPVVLHKDGFKFMFYSNEGDPREPSYIHFRHGREEAKFWLHPVVALAHNDGFNARTLNIVQRLVEKHRDELERSWNEYFS